MSNEISQRFSSSAAAPGHGPTQVIGGTMDGKTAHLSAPPTLKDAHLKSKFQVGSCRSDKINFTQMEKVFRTIAASLICILVSYICVPSPCRAVTCRGQIIWSVYHHFLQVFHSGDIPENVSTAKKRVQKSKQSNILGTQKDPWNISSAAQPRLARSEAGAQYGGHSNLRRTLQKVFWFYHFPCVGSTS